MNLKQRNFAEYYCESGNASSSAERAGYSPRTAYSQGQRLLKNVEVSAYISELAHKAQNERIMTARERQVMLSDIARDEGRSASDRIKAIDTLNKMTGEYITKIEGSISADVNDPFKGLTTEELRRLAYQGESKQVN